ncbi:thioredoxin domain containing protein, putative [Babesia bigemina]|uniref:Thioredoxin domain containing protein, putative n=1 Tax=Babesia bigemina TaxID=5866 RepID=A0A061DCN4_BABBI|nr:thioredoxin domain containing protein, putative [Babesia bigemina]CDR97902.1 thioredoxin domain containing protein, putative [Babesia bigemina]|eukprot:XP_012770088.1 thioredoxin domain containing protein, putative [Babesia bigemina]
MTISKDVLSFANTSYLMEAAQKKCLQELTQTATSEVEESAPQPVHVPRDDLEYWRRERLAAIKRMRNKSRDYLEQGHGSVETMADEKQVINTCNSHKRVICHFYNEEFTRCKILDRHLTTLAAKHLEVKFIRMPAADSPFFAKKLEMQILPTLISVLDGNIKHVFIGFEEFKGDNISVHSLRAALLKRDAITTECCENLDEEDPSEDSD